jgi:hypothetical protein
MGTGRLLDSLCETARRQITVDAELVRYEYSLLERGIVDLPEIPQGLRPVRSKGLSVEGNYLAASKLDFG